MKKNLFVLFVALGVMSLSACNPVANSVHTHNYGNPIQGTPATCTEDAVYYKSCEFCHEKNEETFTVANSKLGHHLIHHQAAESTCQVQGNIEYYECDRCNKLFLDENYRTPHLLRIS